MSLQERLQNIQQENNKKKEEKNRIEGKIEALRQQAKNEFGVDSIEELTKQLEELEPKLEEQKADIESKLEQMENYANI